MVTIWGLLSREVTDHCTQHHEGIGNSQPLSDELLEGFSLKTASKQASNFSDNFLEDSLNLMQNEETFLRIKLKSQSHNFSCFKDCRFGFMNNASQILQQNSTYSRTNEKRFLSESLNWPVLGWIMFCSEFENFVVSYNIWYLVVQDRTLGQKWVNLCLKWGQSPEEEPPG